MQPAYGGILCFFFKSRSQNEVSHVLEIIMELISWPAKPPIYFILWLQVFELILHLFKIILGRSLSKFPLTHLRYDKISDYFGIET